jgi:transposase InsO family protein
MSRKGDCLDNAPMESFFHSLKTERVHHRIYGTVPRLAETSPSISKASTIPVDCIRPWATSAQLSLSVWRPNPVHLFGGRSALLVPS